MPNVGGPAAEKRKLLTTVVHSQLLYAAPIWKSALMYECHKKKLFSPQRKMALRVASAYSTVSNTAIMVVTGIIPIHLLAREKAEVEQMRRNGGDIEAKSNDAVCMYCDCPNDDAEHTFVVCDRWWRDRHNLEVELNMDITSEGMVKAMLQSKSKWDAVVGFITAVMKRKEADKRKIQAGAIPE
ncbi:PREDICTED: uncharacterized protein LOC107166867 [Diuraphis noxia]|uniref:uncharacterized protein LOC107166867 n=1 Tax=Diuraphis noxia TaxID=143948 RepID=UPI0007638157|nr:PREDICTED: uncharacterized protein LOC107166867 [Diuraphis noxia]